MKQSARSAVVFAGLSAAVAILLVVDMMTGSTPLSPAQVWGALCGHADETTVVIVRGLRLVKALVAIMAGAALGVSGLQMQTLFRNPLAGPSVLGITSGASLGVALLLLGAPLLGGAASSLSSLGVAGAAWIGSAAVLVVVAVVSVRMRDIMVVLVLGLMFSSAVGAVVQVLQYLSRDQALKSFVVWTMGSLGDVTSAQLGVLAPAVVLGLLLAVAAVKPLNLLLLGESTAVTMGLNPRRARLLIFMSTTLLAGTVTAFCGPISFIGLAVPHTARMMLDTSDARRLLPCTVLAGAVMMLVCDILSRQFMLPINALTSLMGIPVVVWIVARRR